MAFDCVFNIWRTPYSGFPLRHGKRTVPIFLPVCSAVKNTARRHISQLINGFLLCFLIYGGRHTVGRSQRRIPAAALQTDDFQYYFQPAVQQSHISFQHQNLKSLQAICYIVNRKGTTAHKGLTSQNGNQKCHPATGQSFGVVFLCLKHYFKFENTNVSNARMNIPKAIRSLKSNGFLSISTTPILCKNRGQTPCNTVITVLISSYIPDAYNIVFQ